MTPMMKPTPTTCMAISLEMPNSEQAIGINNSEPPATPEAPQAPRADMMESRTAAGTETCMPSVLAAASVIMVMVMATLLLELKDLCKQQQAQGGESGRVSNHIVEQIQTYIAEHYAEKLTLTGIASQFYISPYYLSRLFKKSINLSLIEYINGVRIKAAQNLIEKTNESISDISEKTGFLTTAHFRRVFKDATGLSPQQYRQYYKRLSK